jgi:hypothetical protein
MQLSLIAYLHFIIPFCLLKSSSMVNVQELRTNQSKTGFVKFATMTAAEQDYWHDGIQYWLNNQGTGNIVCLRFFFVLFFFPPISLVEYCD